MNGVGMGSVYMSPMAPAGTINYSKPDKNNDALDAARYASMILGQWPEKEDK